MARLLAAIVAMLSLALLPSFIFTRAYAGGMMYNADHTLGQFAMLLLVPLSVAIVVLGLWAIRARQNRIPAKS
jgi:hypothetical protein